MKKLFMVALATLCAMVVSPAMAHDFTGPRVELTASTNNLDNIPDTKDLSYGVAVGFDVGLTDNLIVGVDASVDNVFDRRLIGANARVGVVAGSNVLLYARAGYTNYESVFSRKLDGLRVGPGIEIGLGDNLFVKAEYRYANFEGSVTSNDALVGVGIRF